MTVNNKKLMSLFGLKWNPFQPDVPTEALYRRPELQSLILRIENLVMDGGIASVMGESGYGKSVALRLIDEQLKGLRDVTVARVDRPQSSLADFYRELGDLFGVPLRISNRYGGFQALRKKWRQHIDSTLLRPVLLVDEAQSMQTVVLSELRMLLSDELDSRKILTVVLAGDLRLSDRLKDIELVPLGRRIRTRITLGALSDEDLRKMLEHALITAGNKQLMTAGVIDTIIAHSIGSPAAMMATADELLSMAIATDKAQIDEKLFFEAFETPKSRPVKPTGGRR
jgi:type II secretory pathway predicted ATPase ExeA